MVEESGETKPTEAGITDTSVVDAQGLVTVSDADLGGIEDDPEDTGDPEDKGASEDKDDPKDTGDSEDKGDPKDTGDPEDKDDPEDPKDKDDPEDLEDKTTKESDLSAASKSKVVKPPKGFVPTKAIQEARQENSFLKGQLRSVQDQMDALQTQILTPKKEVEKAPDDFKELSESEYATLVDDSPAEALLYMRNLNKYQQTQYAKERETFESDRMKEQEAVIMADATGQMEKLAPGIFDKDSTVHDDLVEFADTLGFSEDLFYLTHPGTQVILPGEAEPLFLGDQAASILGVLLNAKTQLGEKKTTVDPVVDADKLKELEASIRATVEKELLEKFKTDKDATFRSLQQISKSKDTHDFGTDILSSAQFNKLTEADQEKYLSGA